jgi:hypothetical protein
MDDGEEKNDSTNGDEMYNGVPKNDEETEPDTILSASPSTSVPYAYIAAPNILVNDKCSACKMDVERDTQSIECWKCKNLFHAIGCTKDEYCVGAPSVFRDALLPALNKDKGFKNKFGTFLWSCDFCAIEKQKIDGSTVDERVCILDKKMEDMNTSVQNELKEMKKLLVSLTSASEAVNSQ